MNAGWGIACALAVAVTGCGPTESASGPFGPPPTRSCADTAVAVPGEGDLSLNIVYFQGRALASPGQVDDDAEFGPIVGRVRCTTDGSLTPTDYELREGDATHVRAGEPLHRVASRPTHEAVGAYLGGRPHVFVSEEEFFARAEGRCEVPVSQACPS